MPDRYDLIIVGAGLSGLAAAHEAVRRGLKCIVLEADSAVGGRVQTDVVDGFRLDRGFQIFTTSYPEAQRVLDYTPLDLRPFEPGAAVFAGGKFHTLLDPVRRPAGLIDSALADVGTLADKLRIATMRSELGKLSTEELYNRPETTALQVLRARGFSDRIIDRFYRPFFGGITFDAGLGASSRMMEFVFRSFATGEATVPRLGMGQIPAQMAAKLPAGVMRLNTRVTAVRPGVVECGEGPDAGRLEARAVILACPWPAPLSPAHRRGWRGVTNLYFTFDGPAPVKGPLLLLDGDGAGPAINVAIMSEVSPAYAPEGKGLVSATVLGVPNDQPTLVRDTLAQFARWFGQDRVRTWRHLRTYCLPRALPDQSPPWLTTPHWPHRVEPGLYAAGDLTDTASIDGALVSGRRAVETARQDIEA